MLNVMAATGFAPLSAQDSARGGLSHVTIENIIRQKQQYLVYAREQDENIWNDPDFRPGTLLDKIADRIAVEIVRDSCGLLEKTCDEFIDGLVHSEFFPDEE